MLSLPLILFPFAFDHIEERLHDPVHLTLITRDVLGTLLLLCLTLSRAAPLAVSKVRGGGHIVPPLVF